jgi:hypothetical protein
MWNHLPLAELHRMPVDPECSACRNIYDLQRITAIKRLDRMIVDAGPDGYTTGPDGYSIHVDELLDKRAEFTEYLRTGPHA